MVHPQDITAHGAAVVCLNPVRGLRNKRRNPNTECTSDKHTAHTVGTCISVFDRQMCHDAPPKKMVAA